MLQKLLSPAADSEAGLVLSAPGPVMVSGPRPLVRMEGARLVEAGAAPLDRRRGAYRIGAGLVRAARPELRSCFESAFVRKPVMVARSTVELSIAEDGRVEAADVVAGGLVDIVGDLCVVDALEGMRTEASSAIRIQVPLVFFYEGAKFVSSDWAVAPPPRQSPFAPKIIGGPRMVE
jgi:hypothetical protein